jgi:hypothetical protein
MRLRWRQYTLLATLACGPDFDPASVVNRLRVLAIRSEPAAVAPGEDVTLEPLVADPFGDGRTLEYEWAPCASIAGEKLTVLAPEDCADAEDLLVLSTDATLTYTLPEEAAKLKSFVDLISGSGTLLLPVRLIVRPAPTNDDKAKTTEIERAIAQVAIVFEGEPNQNPSLEGLTVDGLVSLEDDAVLLSAQDVIVRADWSAESVESYQVVAQGTKKTIDQEEVMDVAWFSSVGSFDPDHSSEGHDFVNFRLEEDKPPPANAAGLLWAVLTDGRGGVDWLQRPVVIK